METIGRFEVVELISTGGMGAVYLARDPKLSRLIALKVLPEHLNTAAFRDRFRREASAAGTLRHKNIVTVFDVGEHQGRLFIVMEFVPGVTLESVITSRPDWTLERKLTIIEELCDGLDHAHSHSIIHRDIKPANVIVDEGGLVKILDFGVAKLVTSHLSEPWTHVGTRSYMSPEQLMGGPIDHRADVFSASIVAYELFTYRRLSESGFLCALMNEGALPPSLFHREDGLPDEIQRVLKRGLARRPVDRFDTTRDMLRAFSAARGRLAPSQASVREMDGPASGAGTGLAPGVELFTQPPTRAPWVTPRWFILAALVIGVVIVGGVLSSRSTFTTPSRSVASPPSFVEAADTSSKRPPDEEGTLAPTLTDSDPNRPATLSKPPLATAASSRERGRNPGVDAAMSTRSSRPQDVSADAPGAYPGERPDLSSLSSSQADVSDRESVPPPSEVPAPAEQSLSLSDEAAIRATLKAYEWAYENGSAARALALHPTLSSEDVRVLDNSFAMNSSQEFRIAVLAITPGDLDASLVEVRSVISRSLQPRVGVSRRVPDRRAIILLERASASETGWVIREIRSPGPR